MTDLQKAVKLSLISGFIGAVLFAIFRETYANISKDFVLFCLLVGCVVSGILYAKREVKNALCAITVQIAIIGAIGVTLYVLIHPSVESFLEKNSTYFYLSTTESLYYYAAVILSLIGIYFVFAIFHLIYSLITRTKHNGEKTKTYIDNAFDD